MKHSDKDLKMYASNGLRTSEDWASLGREVAPGTEPRAGATIRGRAVTLFGRDQTTRRAPRAPKAPAAPEPAVGGGGEAPVR